MTPLALARKYMNCVFDTGDLDHLREILAEDLTFRGPMYRSNSAEDYVNSLRMDPPTGFSYNIIRTYGDNASACLVYQFSKPGVSTTMAQTFEIEKDRIKSIQLIFDTAVFQ